MMSFAQLKSKSGPGTQLATPQPASFLGQFPVQRAGAFATCVQHQLNTTSQVQTQQHFSNALNQRQSVVAQAKFGEAIQKRNSQIFPVQRLELDEEDSPLQQKSASEGSISSTQGPVVQRLILGANGDLDTQNDDQIDEVVAELQSMDYDSLLFIKDMLDPTNERDSGYIKLINYELGKADVLHDVSEASYNLGGIFTAAAVFVDGQLLGQTEPTTHPDSSTTYYKNVLDKNQDEDLLEEEHNSRNDAEVGTLEEAYNLLADVAGGFTGETQIRIVIAGTSGPCDGCKERLQRFRQDILNLLPNGGILSIDSSYLNSTSIKTRNELDTRYGFTNQQAQTSSRGEQYYNYRYPLAVKGQ